MTSCPFLMLWTAPPPASQCAKLRLLFRHRECPKSWHITDIETAPADFRLWQKADVPLASRDFRLWHKAEVPPVSRDFRFRGLNGHQNRGCRLPLLTRNGSQPPVHAGINHRHFRLQIGAKNRGLCKTSGRHSSQVGIQICRTTTC